MTILGVFIFLIILMTAGIGIDLMRFERERALLQTTLDRAVLAAADLDQELSPKSVVQDYLDKAGFPDSLKSVQVKEGLGFRKVTAVAQYGFPTQFMHLSGVDSLTANTASTAEESVQAVEISLVLDISGSMGETARGSGRTKLSHLKTAAKEFVAQILKNSDQTDTSISIIPYASQVNVGEALLDKFTNVTQEHDYSHCVNFIPEQFSDSDLHRGDRLERAAHFDPFTYSEGVIDMPVCPVRDGSAITPLTNNISVLNKQIDALTAKGNTSIDIGMKWGVALLDPSMRDIVSDLSADGIVPAEFANRPVNYDEDVLKVVIVMTDGQNTDQYLLNPSLRSGLSDVWYNKTAGRYSVYHSQGKKNYYWPRPGRRGEWANHPYGDNEKGTAVRLTYPELFARASLAWNAEYNYRFLPNNWGRWYQAAFSKINWKAKDQRSKHVCRAAKRQGIIVYGIAFEAPASGFKLISDCASSPSHVYDVEGLDIEKAFTSIASSIKKLRLTQ